MGTKNRRKKPTQATRSSFSDQRGTWLFQYSPFIGNILNPYFFQGIKSAINLQPVFSYKISSKWKIVYDLNKKKIMQKIKKEKQDMIFQAQKLRVLLRDKSYIFLLGGPPGVSFEVMVDRPLYHFLFGNGHSPRQFFDYLS